jgi:hypothetical protein
VLNLPDFQDSDCFYFEACGKIPGAKRREERSQKVARIRVAKGNAYLRLLRGGNWAGHLHIDLALARYFPGSHPEINSTRGEIIREIARDFGNMLDVVVFGQYVALAKDIVPGSGVVFAGPSAVVSTINNTVVEVGGAHLVFRNEGFVRTIDWQLYRDDTIFADISARSEVELSPSYLTEIFARLEKAYATYILGRPIDVSSRP